MEMAQVLIKNLTRERAHERALFLWTFNFKIINIY